MAIAPIGTKWIRYNKGILFFNCEHEYHPKSIDLKDKLAPNPITPADTCDNWKEKNTWTSPLGGYPQVCFNCYHSVAMYIEDEKIK